MPDNSFPFPIYSGLLEPKHYKNIGNAIWLFLWCISSTTKEVERDGVKWGIVLGNKPIKMNELAEQFGVTERTIRTWIEVLEKHHYIKTTRTSFGLILTVRNSKKIIKRSEEIFRSDEGDRKKTSDHSHKNEQSGISDRKNLSDHSEEIFRSNKDILKIYQNDDDDLKSTEEKFEEVLQAFCQLHNKLDIQVKALDITAMNEMIALGVPTSLIIRVMNSIYHDQGCRIHSFRYYQNAIREAWEAERAINTPSPKGTFALSSSSSPPGYRTKQQRELDELRRKLKEEQQREQNRSD